MSLVFLRVTYGGLGCLIVIYSMLNVMNNSRKLALISMALCEQPSH